MIVRWRCTECQVVVEKNYDHVGPDCPGACSGTFAHPWGTFCSRDGSTLAHDQVEELPPP